jgi:putative colanic acid biosynthesis glycosyltransferase
MLSGKAMSAQPPDFSIILPCKNPGPSLEEAIESVWRQKQVGVEIVVIDGGSTDGTVEWLGGLTHRPLVWQSGPDSGIYEAMNKGLRLAKAPWVLFLGSDDRLVGEHVLHEVLLWSGRTESAVLCGEVAFDDGRIYRMSSHVRPVMRNFVHHQGTFYRRSLFEEHEGYDQSLQVMADYDFNVRLWKSHVRFTPLPIRVAACASGGISDSGQWRGYREECLVRARYYSPLQRWPWNVGSLVRYFRKNLVRSKRRA